MQFQTGIQRITLPFSDGRKNENLGSEFSDFLYILFGVPHRLILGPI